MRTTAIIAAAALMASCATPPKQHLATLNRNDVAYNSQACIDARNAALARNEHVAAKAIGGFVLGALAGPAALAVTVPVDAAANADRQAFNDELERRCASGVSDGTPTNATADQYVCRKNEAGKVQCEDPLKQRSQ